MSFQLSTTPADPGFWLRFRFGQVKAGYAPKKRLTHEFRLPCETSAQGIRNVSSTRLLVA